jgi:hypothetical protein
MGGKKKQKVDFNCSDKKKVDHLENWHAFMPLMHVNVLFFLKKWGQKYSSKTFLSHFLCYWRVGLVCLGG